MHTFTKLIETKISLTGVQEIDGNVFEKNAHKHNFKMNMK